MADMHVMAEQDYIAGMKYQEIADKYDVSINTVKSWKKRHGWTRDKVAPKNKRVHTKPKGAPAKRESEIETGELTDKQRIFVLEYMRDFNATRAAMAAGYSKKTAYAIGWENLRKPEIQAEIARFKGEKAEELGIDIQRVIMEYMKIAFTDVTDLLEFGQREVPVMTMLGPLYEGEGDEKKPVTKLVNFVDFKDSSQIDGTVISEVKQGKDGVSIKLHDKMKALKELEKYTGFMTEEQKLRIAKLQGQVELLKQQTSKDDDKPIQIVITRKGDRS
ncbi:terminase small subunit [Paenibacillus glucanolyticus]|uniref:terminase small subunit n=1 Tax=Paenibacillus glucanolyticus TaxID=59843 RepID=UPI0030C97F8F